MLVSKLLRRWLCQSRGQLVRWSLTLAAVTPLAAWSIGKLFAVDAGSVVVVVFAVLFAAWRPYRDTWLRPGCTAETRVSCVLR